MNETFISYCRRDAVFVEALCVALTRAGIDPWIDLEDIPPAVKWKPEIFSAIGQCHNFVFVLSPDSVASAYCGEELNEALRHNKRLIPIVCRPVIPGAVHPALGEINWTFFEDFERGVRALLSVLDSPLGYSLGARLDSRIEIRGAGPTRALFLYRNHYLVGRNPSGDLKQMGLICLADEFVSRSHLSLRRGDEGWTLLDNQSRNGVRVNGFALEPRQPHPLRDGDEVRLSPQTCLIYEELEPEGETLRGDDKDTFSEIR